ncbi:MAG: discoidin domain-containing protein, partial [Planctomycetota bacterium]
MEDMWLGGFEPQPTWIEYQFDKVYELHEMWVWNQNQAVESSIGYGFRDVSIEYSIDSIGYTTLGAAHEFAQAPGVPDNEHDTTVDLGGITAKYVRLTANSNWNLGGWLSQCGLSEVRFYYIPVWAREPEPADGAINVYPDVVLGWRAGRE